MKAHITNITALYLQGFVLVPDNIWVPTFWFKDGSSLASEFDLKECVEGTIKAENWNFKIPTV